MHRPGEPWRERVGGWLAGLGCDAWVWQREVTDPAQYAGLWLTDAGERGSPDYERRYGRWLDWFAAGRVEAVGFGQVSLGPTGWEVVTQRLRLPAGLRWSAEVDGVVAALVTGCDGTRTLGELAAVLRAAYGTDPGELERIVRGLVDRGFLLP